MRLPADHAARQMLPSARPPWASANAGIATSTAPNARPYPTLNATIRRTIGGASVLSGWPCRPCSWGSGRRWRTGPVITNPATPTIETTPAAITPALGENTAVRMPTTSGPVMNSSSCAVASKANAAEWWLRPTSDDHSMRTVGATGGCEAPDAIDATTSDHSGASDAASTTSSASAAG